MAMNSFEIGVVVPTLNSASTLDWTLLSLRSQQGCIVRIIVADSGSTDGTLEICKRWGVESVYVPPGNMYRAINAGMKLLNTEWLTCLNSDDLVYRDAYARLMRLGIASRADVVYGHSDYIDGDGRFLYSFSSASPALLTGLFRKGIMGFAQPSAIFRQDVFNALRGFSEDYRHVSDCDFFSRALKAGKVFARLAFPSVCAFRLHRNQLHHQEAEVVRQEINLLLASYGRTGWLGSLSSLVVWRIQNMPNYAIRCFRSQSFRSG